MPPNLQDLPLELLDQIMFFLPPSSVLHLMVNRKLWSICERYLYRIIWVMGHPYRSLHLLETFVLRPDLALSVHELYIDLRWCRPLSRASYNIPALVQPAGLAAVSLAKNIRSLEITGLKWLSDPSLDHIRELVSQMELTSLTIAGWYSEDDDHDLKARQVIISNLRATLRSQPQLEYIYLSGYDIDPVLVKSIETTDIPNLKRLHGPTAFAKACLDAAPKLNDLSLKLDLEGECHALFQETRNGHGIRVLRIAVFFQRANWNDFGSILQNFPNTERLVIKSLGWYGKEHYSQYFDTIASRLRVLPLLRTLEISSFSEKFEEDPGLTAEALLEFKKRCPSLERFVDETERQWVYVPFGEDDCGFHARPECRLEGKQLAFYDLPPIERDV